MTAARRVQASFLASALIHALVLALLALRVPPPMPPALVAIPISLVGRVGGGGGSGNAPAAPPSPPPQALAPVEPPPAAPPRPEPRPARTATREPRKPAPRASGAEQPAAAPTEPGLATGNTPGEGGGAGGGGASGGGGDGSGGDGSGGARVAYGSNPLPPYPLVARRLGKEGVVLLEVLVAPDGRAADVRLLRSSGFAALDESAIDTVRSRWRFIPGRRNGVPVESRVTVPIRFRLNGEEQG